MASGQEQIARILIVEDDDGQRFTLRDILQDEGFETLDCGTGSEALEIVRRQPVAVAIVDYKLPDLSGIETFKGLRAVDQTIRVIIHTGYGSFNSAKEAVNLGASAYIEKPADPAELVRIVHRAAGRWMKQALRKSQEMLRLLDSALEQTNLPVAVTTTASDEEPAHYVFANPAFARMTGYSTNELIGHEPRILHGAKTRRAILERQQGLMREGRSFVGELVLYRKDGSQFFMELRVDPVCDDDGRVTHWVMIYR